MTDIYDQTRSKNLSYLLKNIFLCITKTKKGFQNPFRQRGNKVIHIPGNKSHRIIGEFGSHSLNIFSC